MEFCVFLIWMCLTLTVLDPCSSSPCQNGGSCTPSADWSTYSCSCGPLVTGVNCETSEWILYDGKSYYFAPATSNCTQPDCRAVCQSLGAELLTITSDAENTFILDKVTNDQSLGYARGFWLSIYETAGTLPGTWTWMLNPESTQEIEYTRWKSGEPNNYNYWERCASTWKSHHYEWLDVPCTEIYNYICEK